MENFRIESLEINKIGAFEHIKMDFPKKTDPDKAEIHILTGENGTGKSTVLEALANIAFNIDSEKEGEAFIDFGSKFQGINDSFFKIKNSIYNETDTYFSIKTPPLMNSLFYEFTQKMINYEANTFSFAFFAYSGYRKANNYEKIDISQKLNINPFNNALSFSKSTNTKDFLNWIGNYLMRYTLANSKGDKSQAEKLFEPIYLIYIFLQEITEQTTSFCLNDELSVYVIVDETTQHFNTLPDGVKSMLSWVGDLVMRLERIKWTNDTSIFDRNFILFLDEIEVHLHPAWQRKILPVVQKIFRNAQIFISTHSPFVVGSVDGAWVHKLKKDGAYAVLDGKPVLSEDGKSVRRILDEIFGINQQYGIEVEKELEKFREFRQKIMMGYEYNSDEFNQLVKHLASQSTELEQMMGMEMNQLKRITQKELV